MTLQLKRFASEQWAIVSEDGGLCYEVAQYRSQAIARFMSTVNSDPARRHLKWNCKELKYAKAVKVRIQLR